MTNIPQTIQIKNNSFYFTPQQYNYIKSQIPSTHIQMLNYIQSSWINNPSDQSSYLNYPITYQQTTINHIIQHINSPKYSSFIGEY